MKIKNSKKKYDEEIFNKEKMSESHKGQLNIKKSKTNVAVVCENKAIISNNQLIITFLNN